MQRYYLSDITGTGDIDDPIRPVLADVPNEEGESRVFEIDEAKGVALVLVNRTNHALLIAKRGVDPLPDAPLDVKISAVRNKTIQDAESVITNRGLTVAWNNSDGFRDMVNSIGKEINPNFDVNNFGTM